MRLSVVWRQTIPSFFIASLMEPISMPFREVLINSHFRINEPFFYFWRGYQQKKAFQQQCTCWSSDSNCAEGNIPWPQKLTHFDSKSPHFSSVSVPAAKNHLTEATDELLAAQVYLEGNHKEIHPILFAKFTQTIKAFI